MNSFLKTNKNLVTYSLIIMVIIPIFGIKLLISFLSNILLLLFLIPLLLILIAFVGFNQLRSKINICKMCGTISFGQNDICPTCGSKLENEDKIDSQMANNPSERTIEVKAEEIK